MVTWDHCFFRARQDLRMGQGHWVLPGVPRVALKRHTVRRLGSSHRPGMRRDEASHGCFMEKLRGTQPAPGSLAR